MSNVFYNNRCRGNNKKMGRYPSIFIQINKSITTASNRQRFKMCLNNWSMTAVLIKLEEHSIARRCQHFLFCLCLKGRVKCPGECVWDCACVDTGYDIFDMLQHWVVFQVDKMLAIAEICNILAKKVTFLLIIHLWKFQFSGE